MTAIFAIILHSKQETIAIARVFGKALILLFIVSTKKFFKFKKCFTNYCTLQFVLCQRAIPMK